MAKNVPDKQKKNTPRAIDRKTADYYVVESNELIKNTVHDLSKIEHKVLDAVIAQIKFADTDFVPVYTTITDLTEVTQIGHGGKNQKIIISALESLRERTVIILDAEKGEETITGWFERVTITNKNEVEVRINGRFAPYLLQLTDNYTQYRLSDTLNLSSKYAIRLYQIMREEDHNRGESPVTFVKTPEALKVWLGVTASYSPGKLKERVLLPAIKDINAHIFDMHLELATEKHGRRVEQFIITNTWVVGNHYGSCREIGIGDGSDHA